MSLDIGLVLLVTAGAVYFFMKGRPRVDMVALGVMASLILMGIVTPEQGVSGFSNPATLTVAAMFVLSAGIFRSGAVNAAGALLTRLGNGNLILATALLMIGIGSLSAFMNNTAAVAIFLPIVTSSARAMGTSPSRLLMPLSFASMFGGVCTLVGSSTNLLVSSIAEQHGLPPIGMFELSKLCLLFFGVGLLYMLTVGRNLLPDRMPSENLEDRFEMGGYLMEVVVGQRARSVGHEITTCPLVNEVGVQILEVIRDETRFAAPAPGLRIQEGDILRLLAPMQKVADVQERQGISLCPRERWTIRNLKKGPTVQAEVVLAPGSILEGRSLRQTRFAAIHGAMVLAIRQRGHLIHESLEDALLGAGDTLLVEAPVDRVDVLRESQDFVVVSQVGRPAFRPGKAVPAVAIVAAVIATASMGILPILPGAIVGSILMVATGCLTLDEAYKAIDWKVVFLLAGMLSLGAAMEQSGAAKFLAQLLRFAGGLGPIALVSAFYIITSMLTEVISNNATAVLLAPLAISAATLLNVDPRPLLIAVTFAASASFMTPTGYQTNTMIFSAGEFQFRDFVRVGAPLNLLFWVMATLLIPIFWPF